MAFQLTRAEEIFNVSGGHWSVYLFIAQAFGWQPAGTQAPADYNGSQPWHGQYATNDGQTVTDADAKLFAQVLHAAVVSEHIETALTDMINHTEQQAINAGLNIPDAMRMYKEDFYDEFEPLLLFLYQGGFMIY